MTNVIDVLKERGFIEQTTHDQPLLDYINQGCATCYIGFDPSASSLHVGSLIPIMSLAHMQRNGHRPIVLIGGGTGLVGDPSGKTEMRKLLTEKEVAENALALKRQLSCFIDFEAGRAMLINNADWLKKLQFISFLRDIGRHFSVNRMIKAESYQVRLESNEGLNFIEFNYMVLQAYDFLVLSERYDCLLQMGGSDQWGNIIAGIELIRRIRGKEAFGVTFPLITTSSGAKMGKTAQGAIWLDAEKTSPYDYFQFWMNTDDRDVQRFMALFTFLPMDEIRAIELLKGADFNIAKTILAWETTKIVHGQNEADKAFRASEAMFGAKKLPKKILPSSEIHQHDLAVGSESIPSTHIPFESFRIGIPAFKLFQCCGMVDSSSAARRLIQQGGGYLNGKRIESFDYLVSSNDINGMEIILRTGKKHFHKIIVQE
jgi:tyrosyl-tRNA synthetase